MEQAKEVKTYFLAKTDGTTQVNVHYPNGEIKEFTLKEYNKWKKKQN